MLCKHQDEATCTDPGKIRCLLTSMRETMSYPQLLRQGFDFLGLIIKVKAFACFAVDTESFIAIDQILIVLHRYLPKDGDRNSFPINVHAA